MDRLLNVPNEHFFQGWNYNGNSDRNQLRDVSLEKSDGEKVVPNGQLDTETVAESEKVNAQETATATQ